MDLRSVSHDIMHIRSVFVPSRDRQVSLKGNKCLSVSHSEPLRVRLLVKRSPFHSAIIVWQAKKERPAGLVWPACRSLPGSDL